MREYRTSKILAGGIGLFVILGAAWYFVSSRTASNRLNVIIVTLDTTRADRVGCYGYPSAQTPVMDELAKTGVLFQFARTPYPLTLPAHASIMTALNPPEHGLQSNGRGRLNQRIPVLAEILARSKYDTGAFIAAYVLNSKFGLNRGFEIYEGDMNVSAHQHRIEERQRDGKVVMDSALGWLQQRKSQPFFCWIHLYDPHAPYMPRPEHFGETFTNRPYDAGIAYADLQLGRLKEFLKNQKLTDRTLLVVVGDHGEGLSEHLEPEHGYQLYESTLRVPLIFSGPPSINPGVRVPTPVSLIDLMPTILDYLNIPLPSPVSGRSLKLALSGQKLLTIPTYSESELAFFESRCAPLRSVTTERWKFIETTRPELYDLSADPNEALNLADAEPAQVREMTNILEELREKMTLANADAVNISTEEKRILASLGYVGGSGLQKPATPGETLPDVKEMMPKYVELLAARDLITAGDPSGAMETLRKIVRDMPGYSTARNLLADLFMHQQQYSAAEREYATVVKDQPENAEAHAGLANSLLAQGRLDDALGHFRKSVEIEPDNTSYHYYFAFALARAGNAADAIHELEAAVRIDPAFVDARLPLSKLLADTGRTEEAVKQYEEALKHRPDMSPPPWLPSRESTKKQ